MYINFVALINNVGFSEAGHIFEDGHVFGHACVGALHLHGGEVFGLEIDHALVVAGLLGLVQEVTDCVEVLGLH